MPSYLNAQNTPRSIRPEGPAVRALIARGLERSATFRDLVMALDNADMVVHVRFSLCNGRVPACLLWISGGPTPRRLLIRISRFDRSEKDLIALVAQPAFGRRT